MSGHPAESNPNERFFCAAFGKQISYYDCSLAYETKSSKCLNCITGQEAAEAIKAYKADDGKSSNTLKKKVSRPKGSKIKKKEAGLNPEKKEQEPKKEKWRDKKVRNIHYMGHEDLIAEIDSLTEKNFRTFSGQVMFMLTEYLNAKKSGRLD